MLDKHLIAKTFGKADEDNFVLWGDYRITVLGARLFRIERNAEHVWRDRATQSIWYRNMPKQNFTVDAHEDHCAVITSDVELIIKPERSDCYIIADGNTVAINNAENLLGTCRTLDDCDGDVKHSSYLEHSEITGYVKLDFGVCSKSGVAVLDDAKSLTLDDSGKIVAEKGVGSDEYVFVYGKDYRNAVKALYALTGYTPMLPRYSLGNWWSRYYPYTEKAYLTLLDKFATRNVPLTVATVDMDWHYTDIDTEFGITSNGMNSEFYGGCNGWTGYAWNKRLFPDYKAFLKRVGERGLKITLNVHPAEGIRFFDDNYEQIARAMDIDPQTKQRICFDITDDRFINNYLSCIHKPYEEDGVTFWWIDWQQGTASGIDGLDPLWSLNHYHFLDNALNHEKPIILSRYAGVGSHRYPIGFSGDTFINWNTLRYLPYFTSTASNIGYTWWSHDIGGHTHGITDAELYTRSVQFGVFSPINRLHCNCVRVISKEPWCYGNGTGLIAEEFLRLRHRLIPFLYTVNYFTHTEGRALIEPMYYEYPDNESAYAPSRNQYLFGGLLVAPVVEPKESDGFARVKVWLPCGKYTDIFTKEEYNIKDEKGKCVTLRRRLDNIPVLAKAGAVIPLSSDVGNSVDNPRTLEIKVYSGDGAYTLYEDKEEKEYFTEFSVKATGRTVSFEISGHGDADVVPQGRKLRIVFENVYNGNVKLLINGKRAVCEETYADNVSVTVDYDPDNTYELIVTDDNTEFENLLLRLTNILLLAETENSAKNACYGKLMQAKTEKQLRAMIEEFDLDDIVMAKLKEALI